MRVLVVEDDKNLREQLASALTDAGYTVDSAADGEEGQFLGETEPYDLAILDLGLPKVDGLTVLKAWRKDGKNMPVLILSARDRWMIVSVGWIPERMTIWLNPLKQMNCWHGSAYCCAASPGLPTRV